LNCLTHERIVHKVLIFTRLWLSSSRYKVWNFLAHLVKTMKSRKWC
jgi:hypothetical protein